VFDLQWQNWVLRTCSNKHLNQSITSQSNRSFTLILISSIAALGGLLFGYDTGGINGTQFYFSKYFVLSAALKGWVVEQKAAVTGALKAEARCRALRFGALPIGRDRPLPGGRVWPQQLPLHIAHALGINLFRPDLTLKEKRYSDTGGWKKVMIFFE
jgi:hypothetical protein